MQKQHYKPEKSKKYHPHTSRKMKKGMKRTGNISDDTSENMRDQGLDVENNPFEKRMNRNKSGGV